MSSKKSGISIADIPKPAGMRFRELRKALQLTQEQMAEKIGDCPQSKISDIERCVAGLDEGIQARLVEKFGVNLNWLVAGRDEMFLAHAPIDRPVVVHFRHPSGRSVTGEREGENADLVAIPILRDASAAGPGRVINERDIEGIGVIYKGWCPHPEKTDYVRVKGDSMLPTLPDGSLVTIDKSETDPTRLKGQVVAIWIADRDEVTIKRLRYDAGRKIWKGIPDNITEENLPFDLAPNDRVIGKVRSVHAEVQ